MLPESWIEKIFARMQGRYGSLFMDRWKGCDLAGVKATWAEELAGFADKPECIGYALKSLADEKFPPTLPEFLAACRRAPVKQAPALTHKLTAEDHERVKAAAASAAAALKPKVSDGIDVHWATHPRGSEHLRLIFEAANRDQRFRPCIAQMVADGVCTAEGRLLKTYRDGAFA